MEERWVGTKIQGKKRIEHKYFYGSETNLPVVTRTDPGYYTFQDQ